MSVLLIRVDAPPGGEGLAIRGFTVDPADRSWAEHHAAEVLLPREQRWLEDSKSAVLHGSRFSPQEAGRELWKIIADSQVGTWWQAEVAGAGEAMIRTVLDVRVEGLQTVPWELMTPDRDGPVFRSDSRPWVRASTPWQTLEEMLPPVRVLVVVADGQDQDADGLGADDELAAVYAALRKVPGRWNVDILVQPSLSTLRATLADVKPHVLHVISHGMRKGSEHVLVMFNPSREQWHLTPSDIYELPRPMPRLVVLNACRSADAEHGQQSSWTFSDAFLKCGTAAVVGMQGDIPAAAAAKFTQTFYERLASGSAVDVAAALARREVDSLQRTQNDQRSWALPRLVVAADPDRILPVTLCDHVERRLGSPPLSNALLEISSYVDRAPERRMLWKVLDPEPGSPAPRLILVSGDEKVGKSAVAKSALLTLRLRGRRVIYVDLKKADFAKSVSWLMVLRRIRNALWDWLPEIPEEPRRRFDHEFTAFSGYRDPDPRQPSTDVTPDDPEEFPMAEDYDKWIMCVFQSFRRMLEAAAAGAGLLVVLDGLSGVSTDDFEKWVSPQLLEPIATDQHSNVRWMIVGTALELNNLSGNVRQLAGKLVTVDRFERAELPRLAREYLARENRAIGDAPWWPWVKNMIKDAPRDGWAPGDLKVVLAVSNVKW